MSLSTPDIRERDAAPRRWGAGCALFLVAAMIVTGAWLWWDNTRFVTTHYEASVAAADSSDRGSRVRVAQVSDLHRHEFGESNADLLAALNGANPDLIAVTGDLISYNTDAEGVRSMVEFVEAATDIAPVYYVNGNHEVDNALAQEMYASLSDAGAHVLRDSGDTLNVGGTTVQVMGVNDPLEARSAGSSKGADAIVANEIRHAESSAGFEHAKPTILLSHRPDHVRVYADSMADVVLTGHNHGGQVRLPLIGGLVSPSRELLPGETDGAHAIGGDTTLVISRGLGNSAIPVRVNNPPELVIVDLVPAR